MDDGQSQEHNKYSLVNRPISAPTADQVAALGPATYLDWQKQEIHRMISHQECRIWQHPITRGLHWLHHPLCLRQNDDLDYYQTWAWQRLTVDQMYWTLRFSKHVPTADHQI